MTKLLIRQGTMLRPGTRLELQFTAERRPYTATIRSVNQSAGYIIITGVRHDDSSIAGEFGYDISFLCGSTRTCKAYLLVPRCTKHKETL